MRFEVDEKFRKEEYVGKKRRGERISAMEDFEEMQSVEIDAILEKRQRDRENLSASQKEKMEALEHEEQKGTLFLTHFKKE